MATTTSSPGFTEPDIDRAGEAAEIEVGTVHPLHRQAERRIGALVRDLDRSRGAPAASARHARASLPIALMTFSPFSADIGIGVMDLEAEVFGNLQIARDDLVEARAAVVDQVHLVDGQHDVTDAEHVGDVGVALGLRRARPCARRSG